jgi:hypothetical protein
LKIKFASAGNLTTVTYSEVNSTSEGNWIPVNSKRSNPRSAPSCIPPPPLPIRNAFNLLDGYDNNFPSLNEAAANTYQHRNTSHSHMQTHSVPAFSPLLPQQTSIKPQRKTYQPANQPTYQPQPANF